MAIQNFLYDQINTIFDDCSKIKIYKNGKTKYIDKGTKEFDKILQQWQLDCNDGYEMPAYFVALHSETTQAMKNGLYIEFIFEQPMSHNEMPYDALVLKLENNQYGYTLIRHHNGVYEGRCFHLHRLDPNNALLNLVSEACEDLN